MTAENSMPIHQPERSWLKLSVLQWFVAALLASPPLSAFVVLMIINLPYEMKLLTDVIGLIMFAIATGVVALNFLMICANFLFFNYSHRMRASPRTISVILAACPSVVLYCLFTLVAGWIFVMGPAAIILKDSALDGIF